MPQVNWRETLRNSYMESVTGDLEEDRIAVEALLINVDDENIHSNFV